MCAKHGFKRLAAPLCVIQSEEKHSTTKWPMIPACPSLVCFFNKDKTEGTNSSKNFVFDVCVFFCLVWVCVRTDFVVWG